MGINITQTILQKIRDKAKLKKNGVYSTDGITFAVKNNHTIACYNGSNYSSGIVYSIQGHFIVAISDLISKTVAIKELKKLAK
jgi:hypothetical protein